MVVDDCRANDTVVGRISLDSHTNRRITSPWFQFMLQLVTSWDVFMVHIHSHTVYGCCSGGHGEAGRANVLEQESSLSGKLVPRWLGCTCIFSEAQISQRVRGMENSSWYGCWLTQCGIFRVFIMPSATRPVIKPGQLLTARLWTFPNWRTFSQSSIELYGRVHEENFKSITHLKLHAVLSIAMESLIIQSH